MLTLKVTTVGSPGEITLPKEALDLLGVKEGDRLHFTPAPDGALRITRYDPDFERDMKLAEQIMREDYEIFRALSK